MTNTLPITRRITREVKVGSVGIGGENPIRIQSMLTSDTRDTEACVQEAFALHEAGCEIIRLTAQTKKIAANLEHIRDELRKRGVTAPLVADIHFKPDAALEAAKWVEKVRVNPGNYIDKKKFQVREYTDAQYAEELERIRTEFTPLVLLCQERGVAMRIGANHGSLSDRILNRYGDTPLGMVESAMEFARIAREHNYHEIIFSMKASNPKVMIAAYRLLITKLEEAGTDWNYPVHLGVTEAGDGEDGRIKSAVGIGSLLSDGIGDTIRVSLTEDAIHEIPVAAALVTIASPNQDKKPTSPQKTNALPATYTRRASEKIQTQGMELGATQAIRVCVPKLEWEVLTPKLKGLEETPPELIYEDLSLFQIDPQDEDAIKSLNLLTEPVFITVKDALPGATTDPIQAFRLLASAADPRHPILLKNTLSPNQETPTEALPNLLSSATILGSLLCDGIGDAVLVRSKEGAEKNLCLAYNILQASGARIFKTDFIACPSCGRTLFNLQETTQKIRSATGHLKGVRIAIMGCIVNGPGEMADADFGYVGGAPNKINLYVGKEPVKFNIPEAQAVDQLIALIQEHGKWVEK